MTIQWHFQDGSGVGVLQVSGYLGADSVPRFAGAVGWALARGTGPLIVDLKALLGWSPQGQAAVGAAVLRLAEARRTLELAAVPSGDGCALIPELSGIPVHLDLDAALAAHPAAPEPGGTADPAARQRNQNWRSAGWQESPAG
ncbi:anti-sigma factor antagonist [Streptacidiphilus cavernicola]|uniref:Anti-sigma factor antagonist n=1 Tax=Streptacidiphilus cavernicola TaxID=3342716 RepID=A0ABV6VVP8_9ACTN